MGRARRPHDFDDDQRAALLEALGAGQSLRSAIAAAGISLRSVQRWIARGRAQVETGDDADAWYGALYAEVVAARADAGGSSCPLCGAPTREPGNPAPHNPAAAPLGLPDPDPRDLNDFLDDLLDDLAQHNLDEYLDTVARDTSAHLDALLADLATPDDFPHDDD